MRKDEPEFPETRIPTAMILAMRIVDMFETAGATLRERQSAIDIAGTLVLDAVLSSSERRPPHPGRLRRE
jgi:hypothetical protein